MIRSVNDASLGDLFFIPHNNGGSPGLVVMEGDSSPKVVGSNPSTIYWMNILSHLFVVRIVMFVLKDENKRKRGRRGWPNF